MAVSITYLGGVAYDTLSDGDAWSVSLPTGLAPTTATQADVVVLVAAGRLSNWHPQAGWTVLHESQLGTLAWQVWGGATSVLMTRVDDSPVEHPTPGSVYEGMGLRLLAYRVTADPSDASFDRSFGVTASVEMSSTFLFGANNSTVQEADVPVMTRSLAPDTSGDTSVVHYGMLIVAPSAWPAYRGIVVDGIVALASDMVDPAPVWDTPTALTGGSALTPRLVDDSWFAMPVYDSLDAGIDDTPMALLHHLRVTSSNLQLNPIALGPSPPNPTFATQYQRQVAAMWLFVTETIQAVVAPPPTEECPANLAALVRLAGSRVHTDPPVVIRLPMVTVQAAAP